MVCQFSFDRMFNIHLCQFKPFSTCFTHFMFNLNFFLELLLQSFFKLFSIGNFYIYNQLTWNFICHLEIEICHKVRQHLCQIIAQHIGEIAFSTQHFTIAYMHDLHTGHPCLIGNCQNIRFTFDFINGLLRLHIS